MVNYYGDLMTTNLQKNGVKEMPNMTFNNPDISYYGRIVA
jgi:hypothetical protein